jgi:uncharacterized membrane protein
VVIARMPGLSFWSWLWHSEGNMALYYVLLRPWLHFGLTEASVRLLSVIPGIVSIPLMYLLGARLFGRSIGVLAALLLALNTCAIVYSQEARGYSLLVLGVIASTYLLVRLIDQPSYALACGYAVVAGAMLYSHYFGTLVVFSHAVSLALLPRKSVPWRQLLSAALLLAVLAAPVLWMMRSQPVGHISWVPRPSLLEVYHLSVFLAAESGKGVGSVLLALDLVLLGFFSMKLKSVWLERRPGNDLWQYGLVAINLLLPILITLLISMVRPVFFHRFLIICLPAWILATAVGIQQMSDRRRCVFAIAIVCVLSLVSTVSSYTRVREDWRGVTSFLISHANPQDRVLYYLPVSYFAVESYRDWLPGGNLARPQGVMVNPRSRDWEKPLAQANRVWLVTYPASLQDATSKEIEGELHSRFAEKEPQRFRAVTVTQFDAKAQSDSRR